MEYPINGGRADIVVFDEENKPFIVIETKRKLGRKTKNIDPLSFRVIQQSLGYATFIGAPFFVTANQEFLASFVLPTKRTPFNIEQHRVLITQIRLMNEEFVSNFLDVIVKYHLATTEEKLRITTSLDWTFIFRLRSFISWLSKEVEPVLVSRFKIDKKFSKKVEQFSLEKGLELTPKIIAKEMSYILANKIVFYKILERNYPSLSKLNSIKERRAKFYLKRLYALFEKSINVTKDFEAVFDTGIYDDIVLPDSSTALLDVIDGLKVFIKDMERYALEKLDADIIGHVYEELLEPEERHKLGQFYTPPAIAELICKWAIQKKSDKIIDPAVGSGTFIVKAYQRLKELKLSNAAINSDIIHEENIQQLFSIDINPFPTHLTAVNLAMRNVNNPVSELNVIQDDFFNIKPNQVVFSPYSMKNLRGLDRHRRIVVPEVDAVVANPPYTRWTEISEQTRKAVMNSVGSELKQFKMYPGNTKSEPMIYLHFLIHGTHFLKDSGRLAMIISNSWLQTDYGINFCRFLLENYRIVGIVDFSSRVFAIPLVATLVLLLEKENDKNKRDFNQTTFIFIDKEEQLKPEIILEAIKNPEDYEDYFRISAFQQNELDSKSKIVSVLFGAKKLLGKVREAKKITLAKELFEVTRGNVEWGYYALKNGSRPDIGAKNFFYLTKKDAEIKGLENFAEPALTSARYAKYYTFNQEDWEEYSEKGRNAYFFICHKPKNELSLSVLQHIKWGETECRTAIRRTRGGGKICSQAMTCQAREKAKNRFFGWYDLGGFKSTPIIAIYQSQYRTRFILCNGDFVAYPAIVTFYPKMNLSKLEKKLF